MNTQTGIISRIGNFFNKFMILVEEPDVESPDTISGMAESLVQSNNSELSKDEIEAILNEGLKEPEISKPKDNKSINKYGSQMEKTSSIEHREQEHEIDDDRDR